MHQKQRKSREKLTKNREKVRKNQTSPMIPARKKDRFSLKNRPFKLNTSDILHEIPLNRMLKFLYIINKSMRIPQEFSPKPLFI